MSPMTERLDDEARRYRAYRREKGDYRSDDQVDLDLALDDLQSDIEKKLADLKDDLEAGIATEGEHTRAVIKGMFLAAFIAIVVIKFVDFIFSHNFLPY
jgi:hypothetical protein